MRRKKKTKKQIPSTFHSDLKWCIENDWQVYVVPSLGGPKIGVRKGGISSCGKDYHVDNTGKPHYSSEQLGQNVYKSQSEAGVEAAILMKKLREKYDR